MPREILERVFLGSFCPFASLESDKPAGSGWLCTGRQRRVASLGGYAAAGLVGARLIWGVIGPPSARFVTFFPTPARIRAYLRTLGQPMLGHNPIGAIMILLLLALVLALGVTGWLLGTDAYWGDENLETLHEALAYGLLGCALIHVAGVLLVSWRTRVNLLKAMLTGYKVRSDDALPFRD